MVGNNWTGEHIASKILNVFRFLRYRRAEVLMRNKQLEILEDLLRQINIEKKKEKEVQFTLGRCLLESVFIGRDHSFAFGLLLRMATLTNSAVRHWVSHLTTVATTLSPCISSETTLFATRESLVILLLKYFPFSVDVVHSTSSGDHVPHNVL